MILCVCVQSGKSLFCKRKKYVRHIKTNHPPTAKAMVQKPLKTLTGLFCLCDFLLMTT